MAWTTPATWAVGEALTAAKLNEQLRDNMDYLKARADSAVPFAELHAATLGSAAANITVIGIPATYRWLRLNLIGTSDRAQTLAAVLVEFNNDSNTANYVSSRTIYDTTSRDSSVAGIKLQGALPGASAAAGSIGMTTIDILNYNSTSQEKLVTGLGFRKTGTGASDFDHIIHGGLWTNTANAISQIKLTIDTGENFNPGTQLYIYGLGD